METDNREADLLALSQTCKRLHEIFKPSILPYNISHCGNSGLHLVVAHNDLLVKAFHAGGANLDSRPRSEPNPIAIEGKKAIDHGHDEIEIFLLENGASPWSTDWCNTSNVFCLSINKRRSKVTCKILENEAFCNSSSRHIDDMPVVKQAAKHEDLLLLNAFFRDIEKRRPTSLAKYYNAAFESSVSNDRVGVLKVLIAQGAQVDNDVDENVTPLIMPFNWAL
ncbi:hypothetical protein BDW69DRAFT_180959 [Aspergillus filifer]